MKRVVVLSFTLIEILPLITCNNRPLTSSEAPGTLSASVQGAIDYDYIGEGTFYSSPDPNALDHISFGVVSVTDSGSGLLLYRSGADRPGLGVYELGPLTETSGGLRGFIAYLRIEEEGWIDGYAAVEGKLTIRRSGDEWLEGEFNFSALPYCSRPSETPPPDDLRPTFCNPPDEVQSGADPIIVHGSFLASETTQPIHGFPGH